jgi:8-oxo-dGTP diphosphatase
MILLIRHTWAGHREDWDGDDDRLRPLDERGRRQAEELVDLLAPHEIDSILSSPYVRCVQSVEPLAQARGLSIEEREELTEELQATAGVRLVLSLESNAAVCCHGGLSEALCGRPQEKGEVFLLEVEDGEVRLVGRLGPPS